MILPTSRMSTASSMSRSNMIYQAAPSQVGSCSFFEEAIDTSPVLKEVGLGSSYIALPTQPAKFKILRGKEAPQDILSAVVGDKKLNRPPHNWRQSQANSALLEPSASGQAAEIAKPRRRGRKPKKQPKQQTVVGQQEEPGNEDLSKDPHRRRILERNRMAATKCRLRKRDEALALASHEIAMEEQNRYLSSCFDSLTTEIYYLKTQLLRHTHCNCVLIQEYITNEAKRCVDRLLACFSAFSPNGSSLRPDHGSPCDASTADSLNMLGLEADSFPLIWTNPFQRGPCATEVRGDVFDRGLEPLQTAAMPPDSMVSTQPVSTSPLTICGPGLSVNMEPRELQADEIAWDPFRKF